MRTTAKLGLTALMAAFLLASAISTASARSLSTSEQSFRSTFSSLEFVTELVTVRCRVTLEGSFHTRTIAKVAGSLVGAITRATVAHPCTNGEAWADNGTETQPLGRAPQRLPFHLTYQSFAGALPTISTVNLAVSRASFVIQSNPILGFFCRGRYGRPEDSITAAAAREAGGGITELTPNGSARLVDRLGNAECPATGAFRGTGTLANLSNGSRITVTLI
jgi:hypothetical protein